MRRFDKILSDPKTFIQGYSYHYPVPEYLLAKYEDLWDWKALSVNENIQWNIPLLEKFQHKWNWYDLSKNKSIPWSPELLIQFKDKWNWYCFCEQAIIINDLDMLSICLTHWDDTHQEILFGFDPFAAKIDNLHYWWVEELFENWPALNWKLLSNYKGFPWTEDFIRQHADKLDWKRLSWNTGLPWSMEFIYEYLHKWAWNRLSLFVKLPWSVELIETFKDYWDWWALSKNEFIQWDNDILIAFKDQIYWVTSTREAPDECIEAIQGIYNQPTISWTPELYEACNEAIENQFKHLAEEEKNFFEERNTVLLKENEHWTIYQDGTNWTEAYMKMLVELNKQYSDKIFINWDIVGLNFKDWETYGKEMIDYCKTQISLDTLTQNPYFPWHKHSDVFNRLAEYKKDWKGWNYLSANKELKLTEEMIDQYKDKWDWVELSRCNTSLTPALIDKYKDHLDWVEIWSNPIITEIYPPSSQDDWYDKDFAYSNYVPFPDGSIGAPIDNNLLEEILINIRQTIRNK